MKEGKDMNLLTENLKKVDMFNDILESLKSENKAISFKKYNGYTKSILRI